MIRHFFGSFCRPLRVQVIEGRLCDLIHAQLIGVNLAQLMGASLAPQTVPVLLARLRARLLYREHAHLGVKFLRSFLQFRILFLLNLEEVVQGLVLLYHFVVLVSIVR